MKAFVYRPKGKSGSVIVIIPVKLKSYSFSPNKYFKIFLGNTTKLYVKRYLQKYLITATELVTGYLYYNLVDCIMN